MIENYIHGFSESEQRRLTLMQSILNDAEMRAIDLRGVRSILDVGSGLGQLTRALARAAPLDAQVIGVERDERQLLEAERQAVAAGEAELVEFRRGEAESLPLTEGERGTFDLVHARFLLEHVSDPLAVVREMVAAARVGGRLVLLDDDHDLLRFWPPCLPVERVWRVYWESYRDRGHDPLVGRRLAGLLAEAGACPCRVTSVFYGSVKQAPLFEAVVDNLAGVLAGAAKALAHSGSLQRSEMDAALAALDAWRQEGAATVWYSLPLAEGERTR
jgi:SAM-dependent methyltransferase